MVLVCLCALPQDKDPTCQELTRNDSLKMLCGDVVKRSLSQDNSLCSRINGRRFCSVMYMEQDFLAPLGPGLEM